MSSTLINMRPNDAFDGYNLYFDSPDINTAVFGCDGTGESDQKKNAAAIKKKAQNGDIQFVIHLGDAIYSWNANGASRYEELDQQLISPHAGTNIPFFMLPGNHDKNIHRTSFSYEKGIQNHQKLNAFYQGDSYDDKQPPKLSDDLEQKGAKNKFNARPKNPTEANNKGKTYYSVSCFNGEGSTQAEVEYLLIDTNSLPYDEDQKHWIKEKIRNSNARNIVICCHHPILTFDKRLLSRQDSRYYKKSALAGAGDDEDEKIRINNQHSVYKRQYGLSHNAILKGVFRDEIFTTDLDDQQKEKVAGFLTAHNHWQGTVVGKKPWEKIATQGAAGKETSLPKHRCIDLKGKIRHSKKATGFGVAKSTAGNFCVENYSVESDNNEAEKCSGDMILRGEGILSYLENSDDGKCHEIKKKLTGLDKILRQFVAVHTDECHKGKKYDLLTRHARFLHNRLLYDFRNHIINNHPKSAIEHLGEIAKCVAAFLVKLHQEDSVKLNGLLENRFGIDNIKEFSRKELLAQKHFYHMPYFRFVAIALVGVLIMAALAFGLFFPPAVAVLPALGLTTGIKIGITSATGGVGLVLGGFAEYKTWRCRSSEQFRFFQEADKLLVQQEKVQPDNSV